MRFDQLLLIIHNKNAAANKGNAECCEFIPDQWSDPFKIICGAHGCDLCTYTINRCTLEDFQCLRFCFFEIKKTSIGLFKYLSQAFEYIMGFRHWFISNKHQAYF